MQGALYLRRSLSAYTGSSQLAFSPPLPLGKPDDVGGFTKPDECQPR